MKDDKKMGPNTPAFAPATSDEERRIQLSSLALDAIEQRVRDGRASSAELLYLAKIGSQESRLEIQQMQEQVKLLQARTEDIQRSKITQELYQQVLDAFQEYSGATYTEEDDFDERPY